MLIYNVVMLVLDGVRRPGRGAIVPLATAVAKTEPVALVSPFRSAVLDGIKPKSASPVADAIVDSYTVEPSRSLTWPYLAAGAVMLPMLLVASATVVTRLQDRANASHPATRPAAAKAAPAATAASTQAATAAQAAQTEAATKAAVAAESATLQQILNVNLAGQGAPFGVVVKNLKSGAIAQTAPDQVFTSASLYKLFVAQVVYRQIDTGAITLNSTVPGTGRSVNSCLHDMITWSDNYCGGSLGQMVGWQKQNGYLTDSGYHQTNLKSLQQTSAGDVARLFERLYNGTLLSPSSTDHFLGLLKQQRVNNRLPTGLPAGTTIAHKTGDLNGFVHDAGIVYGAKTDYLVVVTTGPWRNPSLAPAQFQNLVSKLNAQLNP